jgi:hypothetical protein
VIYGFEREVERLRREREARIKAFDGEPVLLERKAKHRTEWLAGDRIPDVSVTVPPAPIF